MSPGGSRSMHPGERAGSYSTYWGYFSQVTWIS